MNGQSMAEVLNVISIFWNSFSEETKKDVANAIVNNEKVIPKVTFSNENANYLAGTGEFSFSCHINVDRVEDASIEEIARQLQKKMMDMGKRMRII
jgi:acetylornithine deacetylase/succinyl-diaminopimelate desuccinylase-like protein